LFKSKLIIYRDGKCFDFESMEMAGKAPHSLAAIHALPISPNATLCQRH